MPESFVLRRIDVLLVDLVQQLDEDYPELPYGQVAGCVEVARRAVGERHSDDDAAHVVALVERAARVDLDRLCRSIPLSG